MVFVMSIIFARFCVHGKNEKMPSILCQACHRNPCVEKPMSHIPDVCEQCDLHICLIQDRQEVPKDAIVTRKMLSQLHLTSCNATSNSK